MPLHPTDPVDEQYPPLPPRKPPTGWWCLNLFGLSSIFHSLLTNDRERYRDFVDMIHLQKEKKDGLDATILNLEEEIRTVLTSLADDLAKYPNRRWPADVKADKEKRKLKIVSMRGKVKMLQRRSKALGEQIKVAEDSYMSVYEDQSAAHHATQLALAGLSHKSGDTQNTQGESDDYEDEKEDPLDLEIARLCTQQLQAPIEQDILHKRALLARLRQQAHHHKQGDQGGSGGELSVGLQGVAENEDEEEDEAEEAKTSNSLWYQESEDEEEEDEDDVITRLQAPSKPTHKSTRSALKSVLMMDQT